MIICFIDLLNVSVSSQKKKKKKKNERKKRKTNGKRQNLALATDTVRKWEVNCDICCFSVILLVADDFWRDK